MSRNAESRFAVNPTRIDMSRSRFDRNSSVKTSFNVGQVVPFYLDEVLPGDTFKIRTNKVVRLQTLITPMMDNLYLDTYYFFVPNRLVWSHWKEFNGENTESAWIPETTYEVPQITSPATDGWVVGTLADYFGLPTGVPNLSVSALPFRAYALVINEWFRDQNLQDPLVIPVDDAGTAGVNTGNYVTDVAKGGLPFVAAKYHDYFTSCLPAPQKGPDVTIPVSSGGNLPVVSLVQNTDSSLSTAPAQFYSPNAPSANTFKYFYPEASEYPGSAGFKGSETALTDFSNQSAGIPMNLWAVDDGAVSSATINQLRMAFQIQKLYERDARGGSRYIEILKSHFGVTSPDSRLQRPEYLGGNRVPIHINQVIQQSATDSTSPQGNVAGQSLTTDSNGDFTRSFTEHGYVIGLMVVRYPHTYQQGIERHWSRKTRFDYYWPVFANIGEQAVLNKEIYAQGSDTDDEVFGYQEAWADYRYKPSRVTGEMRSQYAQSLDSWHLADDYTTQPFLSASWIQEDASTVDRVLAVTSEQANQVFCDVYVQNRTTRPMPMYSIPGLIDHH